ncbi:hypothetical protein PLICRDRAFT_94966, partial [Plicaturopsis crispa FD-325 SS-3]
MFEFNCAARKLYEDDKSRMMLALELHVRVLMLYKRWSFHGAPLLPSHGVDMSAGTPSISSAPSISSSRVTRRRRAAPPPPRISNDDAPRLNARTPQRLTARTLRAHRKSTKAQQVPWTTTIWQWILSYQHAIDTFGMDSLPPDTTDSSPPDTMDEDGDEEDIPDNYEFYLANDEHDVPDLLRFSRPRERLRTSVPPRLLNSSSSMACHHTHTHTYCLFHNASIHLRRRMLHSTPQYVPGLATPARTS